MRLVSMGKKKKKVRFNTAFLPHYIYKLHKYWVLDTSFVNKEDRGLDGLKN
jgi:hypothetical protein